MPPSPPTQLSNPRLEEFLEPSFSGPGLSLFSMRASFFVAFFGGVFATAVFGFVNAKRMSRAGRDGWIYVLAAIAWGLFVVWAAYALTTATLPSWLSFAGSGRSLRYAGRFVALAVLGLMYLRQKTFFRTQELTGLDPADPWPVALTALAVAFFMTSGLALVGHLVAGA